MKTFWKVYDYTKDFVKQESGSVVVAKDTPPFAPS
jgi:hypothetical protein